MPGPDALLATKLRVPRTPPGFVPRPRLVDRLGAGPGGELTLVCAPAGFGKTALLADWSRRSPQPVAWLSLDAGDNDPARFWGHAVAARLAAGERHLALIAGYDLGGVQRAQGRLGAAAATYHRALALGTEVDPPLLAAAGMAQVGLAELLRERDELDAALDQAGEGIARCRQPGNAQPLAAGLVTLAWIRQVRGDRAGARAAIAEAERVGAGPAVIDLFNPVAVQRARLLLAQGEVAEAARWTAERGLDAADRLSYLREPGHLVLARVLLVQGAVGRAREPRPPRG